ncbi:GNAT family N-acetyltransferase [Pontibacter sp. JH31]|uniref:GNAT family N-acetyltransferase n=1 Tax=Pontibacter aquaedesilientis TaxID=2766980 RepID=A0ABR7XFH2_9BACT|nr:GNAT family N-acetyltransferase [Pontibacter aquaedesilientis]MBD1397043.1 GNAT family N-acetyltransferase [Pontibacter aquaedesilientis]
MTDIAILPCSTNDLALLQRIALAAYDDHYTYLWQDGGAWYKAHYFTEEALSAELTDPNTAFFLIYQQDEPVGFLKLNKDKALEGYTDAECLELERLYLLERASGIGIGKWAIDFTMQYALEQGKSIVWLKAMDSSRSVEFYEHNGFTKCGTHELDFEQMKEMYRGMIVMKREV